MTLFLSIPRDVFLKHIARGWDGKDVALFAAVCKDMRNYVLSFTQLRRLYFGHAIIVTNSDIFQDRAFMSASSIWGSYVGAKTSIINILWFNYQFNLKEACSVTPNRTLQGGCFLPGFALFDGIFRRWEYYRNKSTGTVYCKTFLEQSETTTLRSVIDAYRRKFPDIFEFRYVMLSREKRLYIALILQFRMGKMPDKEINVTKFLPEHKKP